MFFDSKTLTPEQVAAVTTRSRDSLVVAGAGAGKTRVMVQRVAHLIRDRGMSPLSIMMLTFTRRAAGELLSRLRDVTEIPADDLRSMMIGTFHSIAYRILRQHGAAIGYDAPPTIVSPRDVEDVLINVADDLGFRRGATWRNNLSLERVLADLDRVYRGDQPENDSAALIISEYHARMRAWRCLDFGMLLMECSRLFRESPAVLAAFRAQVRAVLVDELQDADETQHMMHDWFSPPAEFMGVGDRRQTIYRFRGARPELMTERHPGAEIIDLRQCFRCGDSIVEAANRLIAHNEDAIAKPMIGATGRRGLVETMTGRSSDIVVKLRHWRELGYRWEDMAVLARRHATLVRVEDALRLEYRDNPIPWHRVQSCESLFDTRDFRWLLASLCVAANPRAFTAREALRAMGRDPARCPDDLSCVVRCVEAVCGGSRAPWAVYWTERFAPGTSVAGALAAHAMRDAQDDLPSGGVVTLATIHAAKGLEWPCVLVANCDDGELPSAMSLREEGGLEDERRLMYVAMTRAKERLTLHYRREGDDADEPRACSPSRFLMEAKVL